jgi:glutaconyl-CoA/methylmalonyl-CoA decarboxylase subunit gamma
MKSYKISVNGKSYDVTVEELGAAPSAQAAAPAPRQAAPVLSGAPAAPAPAAAAAGAAGLVRSPMPGTLLSYKVAQGQAVKRGQVLLILEAMKMENEIVAPVDGVVAALKAAEGASVSTGDVLVELA